MTTMVRDRPAVLGGMPIFEQALGIVRPLLPPLEAIYDRLEHAMATGQLTNNGQYVRELEGELSSYFGVKHAVTVANATLGLMILARALGREGEIIMPSFTFSATSHAAIWAGLRPVFADIMPDTYTLDLASVARLVNDDTTAIMGVHIYGHPCEIDELQTLADERQVPLVFDAAHAFGSRYKGRRVGAFGLAEIFSFHATKIFPVGEGGVITTDDDELAAQLRLLRVFGDPGTENTQLPGLNAKMQEFNALIGLENLKVVDQHAEHRRAIAGIIQAELADVPGLAFQTQRSYAYSNYQNLSILVDEGLFGLNRDQLFLALKPENVKARKYFYPPVHKHDACADIPEAVRAKLTVTEYISDRVLCLPIYSDMSELLARDLCATIKRIQAHALAIGEHLRSAPGGFTP
jgi:dTDP-4-amino-4,6-dideoxygalactose transaminase